MEKEFVQYPSSCKRIVFLGPESTGKTTLSQYMAAAYHTQWVPEYMRLYLQVSAALYLGGFAAYSQRTGGLGE